jgi:hypothetical protein
MTEFFIHWFGFFLIWVATDIGRKEDSKIEIFSWNFLWQMLLISIGGTIAYVKL